MYIQSEPLSKGLRGGGNTVYRHSGSLKVIGQVGTQGTEMQDLYLKVRGEEKIQCRDTQALYLKVRGERGDSVQTFRTSI